MLDFGVTVRGRDYQVLYWPHGDYEGWDWCAVDEETRREVAESVRPSRDLCAMYETVKRRLRKLTEPEEGR